MSEHRHEIEGGYIVHEDHNLGETQNLDPVPFEGHRHLLALIERNYVHEYSGPAFRTNEAPLEQARKRLLEAEDALERAGYDELAFEIGLKADNIAEWIAEAQDDGSIE